MPPKFGFIGEGITDYAILNNILRGYFQGDEEPLVFSQLKPRPKAAGETTNPPGGWSEVLRYLEGDDEYKQALTYLDYLIIQIDTDVSENAGFGVAHHDGGRELPPGELSEKIIRKLESLIEEEFYSLYKDAFIFAIAVHQTECWLLPILTTDSKKGKITGCLGQVNHYRHLASASPLVRGERKHHEAYDEASREFRKRKRLLELSAHNPSLKLFIDELNRKLSESETAEAPEHPAPSDGECSPDGASELKLGESPVNGLPEIPSDADHKAD